MAAFPGWLLPGSVLSLAGRAADLARRLPANVISVLGLATKHDVDLQSRMTRKKTTTALRELVETQRLQTERLELLHNELREELQSFAAAINDQLFAIERTDPRRTRLALDDDVEDEFDDDLEDDDEIDLVSYDAILAADDDVDIDLSDRPGYPTRYRRSALDD